VQTISNPIVKFLDLIIYNPRLFRGTLCLYIFATWTSMAGMEIFGWLSFLFVCMQLSKHEELREILSALPWKMASALFLLTIFGLLLNHVSTKDTIAAIGSQRWVFLLFSHSFALAAWPPTERGYKLFLSVISVVAVYSIFQSQTGIDLLRPGSNRAVQALDVNLSKVTWRSAGLFASPMHYMYVAGQHVCFALAFALVYFKDRKKLGLQSLWYYSMAATVIVTASLITTHVRGGWIGLAFAFFVICFLSSPKAALALVAVGGFASAGLIASVESIRLRFATLLDFGYRSNSERNVLWKINFDMFRENPWFGLGYQENESQCRAYMLKAGYSAQDFCGHAHSNYLQMLSGMGAIGFLVYICLIGYMLWLNFTLWKTLSSPAPTPTEETVKTNRALENRLWPKALTLGCLGAQIQLHVGGLTECNFKTMVTNHNLMLVWALVISLSVLNKTGKLSDRLDRSKNHARF
jgi:hypothetical protein